MTRPATATLRIARSLPLLLLLFALAACGGHADGPSPAKAPPPHQGMH
jgi:hypothetical protein